MKIFSNINLLWLILILSACHREKKIPVEERKLTESSLGLFMEIKLDTVFSKYQAEELVTVEVQFKTTMKEPVKYNGIPFLKILEDIYGKKWLDSLKKDHAIELVCKDGYCPQMPLSDVWKHDGYLVDRLTGEPNKWPAGFHKKYAPFYLVWKDEKNNQEVPWPYGLVSIRLVDLAKQKACLMPGADKIAEKGFYLFKKYCMKCHSINGQGGVMGPELNYPKNIISYWQEDQLFAFVKSPQSFSYNHKMRPVKKIAEKEMKLIIEYFKHIEKHSQLCD